MALSSTPRSAHGTDNRGIEGGKLPGGGYGRFGRMFPFSQRELPDDCLRAIAKAMIKTDVSKPIDVPEPADENPTIPSGYTYFGQFIDHDISLDPSALSIKHADVAALEDFRTPAFDLDCIYGRGPDDQPYMYQDGMRLRLGTRLTARGAPSFNRFDVFRIDGGGGTFPAVLGDKRNDENRLVAQIQAAFIAFHNKVVIDDTLIAAVDGDINDEQSRFRAAVRLTRWHYQWLVFNDFLPRIVQANLIGDLFRNGVPDLAYYPKADARYSYMPVEFAGAAYRFGHSQVRPGYALNLDIGSAPGVDGRLPIFTRGGATENLNGFGRKIPDNWGLDWAFFVDGGSRAHIPAGFQVPQPSYRIDANLVDPLADLPEFFDKPSPLGNLAYRNLVRGVVNLRLPSGEQVARAMRHTPLSPEILWGAGSKARETANAGWTDDMQGDLDEVIGRRKPVYDTWVKDDHSGPLAFNTPLWFYILREAEYYGYGRTVEGPTEGFGGQCLGPIGSRIVAETFVALLWNDESSYLRRWPDFKPLIPKAGATFKLADLLAYATSP